MRRSLLCALVLLTLSGCDTVVLSPSGFIAEQQRDLLLTSTLLMLIIVIPPTDDVHRVRTTSEQTSVSIHLLANDTGCIERHSFDETTGEARPFVSGYVNAKCPAEPTPDCA